MSQNSDYFDYLEQQFPQEKTQLSEDDGRSSKAKDKGLKIFVMALFGLIALILLIVIIKSIVAIFIGLACLGVLIGLFASAEKKGG